MINMPMTGYNKAHIKDLRGKRDIELEVNFSDNPDFKDCARITVGKEELVVSIKDLYEFVFWVASQEQQDNLIPMKQTKVRTIQKLHKVEVKKDIRKGEFLNVRCITNVPVEIVEGLKGMLQPREYEQKIIVPTGITK